MSGPRRVHKVSELGERARTLCGLELERPREEALRVSSELAHVTCRVCQQHAPAERERLSAQPKSPT
jgi:hypothetical protein